MAVPLGPRDDHRFPVVHHLAQAEGEEALGRDHEANLLLNAAVPQHTAPEPAVGEVGVGGATLRLNRSLRKGSERTQRLRGSVPVRRRRWIQHWRAKRACELGPQSRQTALPRTQSLERNHGALVSRAQRGHDAGKVAKQAAHFLHSLRPGPGVPSVQAHKINVGKPGRIGVRPLHPLAAPPRPRAEEGVGQDHGALPLGEPCLTCLRHTRMRRGKGAGGCSDPPGSAPAEAHCRTCRRRGGSGPGGRGRRGGRLLRGGSPPRPRRHHRPERPLAPTTERRRLHLQRRHPPQGVSRCRTALRAPPQ